MLTVGATMSGSFRGKRERLQRHQEIFVSSPQPASLFHASPVLAWIRMSWCATFLLRATYTLHSCWSEPAHTKACLPNFFSSQFWPMKFPKSILTTCDCVHGLFYRVSDALNVINCELHPTEFTLIYSGRLDMYSSVRSVQFSSKVHLDDRARDLYIYHCFIWHHVICCVIAHMYLCTECVYWYKIHSYGYLWIYIVLNANPYKWSIKLFMTNRVCLWYLSVWDCQVVMLESIINNMEIVFQLKKTNKLLTCLFNDNVSVTYGGG